MTATAREPTAPHYSAIEADQEARILPGSLLLGGRLEIVGEVARGGMSVVYRAIDHAQGDRHVALKIVTAEAEGSDTAARFLNDLRLAASLEGHPHVVRALGIGCLDGPQGFEGRMYLVTEMLEGVSLDRVMADHRLGLDWRRACTIARDVARALVDLHERGIVHRDIKPGNVLLTQGETEKAMLIDFGLAYATGDGWEEQSPDLTQEGHAPGTVLYMPPEQMAHERPAPSMDAYSFGVMLYELFSGNPPHHKLGVGELLARKCDRSRPPFPIAKLCPELDPRLTVLVDRCLHFDAPARPRARELLATLEAVIEAPPIEAAGRSAAAVGPVTELQPAEVALRPAPLVSDRPTKRGKGWLLGAAGALAAMASIAALWSTGTPAEPVDAATPTTPTAPPAAPSESRAPVAGIDPGIAAEGSRPAPAPVVAQQEPTQVDPPSPGQPPAIDPAAKRAPKAPNAGKAKAKPRIDECPTTVRDAQEAAASRQWGRVIRLTKSSECWTPQASAERTKLRTQALFETLRYNECAAAGKGSTHPDVIRWVRICESKSQEEAQ